MTTTLLIVDLEEAKGKTPELANGIDKIIALAKNGVFHDFISNEGMPKILLATHLKELGLKDLMEKTIDGDYDE